MYNVVLLKAKFSPYKTKRSKTDITTIPSTGHYLVRTRLCQKNKTTPQKHTFAATFLAHSVQDSFKCDLLTGVVSKRAFFPLILTGKRRKVPLSISTLYSYTQAS